MDNNEVKVVVPENYSGPIVVLQGKAPDPINLKPVTISGDIHAVEEYCKRDFEKKNAVIIFNGTDTSIRLMINQNHPHSETVTAKLAFSDIYNAFGINTGSRLSIGELKSLLKRNRFYFVDKDAHTKLLISLNKVEMKAVEQIKQEKDDRGNSLDLRSVELESNIGDKFTLMAPIFKGMPASQFQVEICLERRDKGVSVWLESPEAQELITDTWEKEMKRQIDLFRAQEITCICS